MTLKQHRLIQWIAITLILSLGAGYYYQTQVKGAQTVISGETPSFQADLKNTLDLQKGVGKPTFTRATTATVTDFEGIIRTAKSGEARFEGARRVENLLTYSEDFSNAAWAEISGTSKVSTTSTDPNGGNKAVQLSNVGYGVYQTSTAIWNGTYVFSIWLKDDGINHSSYLLLMDGGTAVTTTSITTTSSWKKYTITGTRISSGNVSVRIQRNASATWYAAFPQLEDVTGQANQNPSEYVSTNVLTSAPYHGANVDGVKYFTTENGNTVASNVVTESAGAAIPDATLHGYVAEGSRTNLLTYSEQFDNAAAWLKARLNVSANALISPDGKTTADKITDDTTASISHYIFNSQTKAASSLPYSFSVYLKMAERYRVRLHIYSAFTVNSVEVDVDLSLGALGTAIAKGSWSNASATITQASNGFYKVTLSGISDTSTTLGALVLLMDNAGNTSYTGDGTSGIYIWGAQLEAGSFASSYIPTTTASVTRNADVLTYPSSGNVLSTVGSTFLNVIFHSTDQLNSGPIGGFTSASVIYINPVGWVRTYDGVNIVQKGPFVAGVSNKIANSWGGSNMTIALNGSKANASFDGELYDTFSDGKVYIGRSTFGTYKNVKIWKKALTDTQLTNLTSSNDAVAGSAVKGTTLGTDGASFQADLKSTLDLQKGIGKPTFTRATTATVTDFEGLLKTAKSGEARFEGARRVENFLSSSENFDISSKGGTASVTGTKQLNFPAENDYINPSGTAPSRGMTGENIRASVILSGSGTIRMYIQSSGGSIEFMSSTIITLTSTPTRYSIIGTSVNTGHTAYLFIIKRGVGDTATTVLADKAQLENVTGQANQNPSEYVSTGVLTSAPYHGANVDGVKYFTTENGNTVASNVVTEATGAAIPDATLKGYVAEGSRTNLLAYSEQFDNVYWTKQNAATITPDTHIAPNGTQTADTLTISNGATDYLYRNNANASVGGTFTISVFARSVSGTKDFKFSTYSGTDGTQASSTFTATTTWQRYSFTVTLSAVSTGFYIGNMNGLSTGSLVIWGAQLEQASFPSSYIPTTTASVTRNADVLSYPSAGNVLPSIGTYYAEAMTNDTTNSSANALVFAWTDSSNINSLQFYFNQLRGSSYNTGVFSADIRAGAITTNTKYKSAYRYATDNFGTFLNGTKVGSDTSGSPMLSNLSASFGIGNSMVGAQNLYGTIRNVKIWKKALTDGQLTAMTSANDAVAGSAVKQTTINAPQNDKLTNGLVGFWSFNGLDMSGTTAYDRSGSNNHGTLTGGPTRAIGKVGQGLSFDGVDDFVNLGTSSSSVKTISFWVKPSSTTQSIADLNGTQTVDIASGVVRANSFTSPTIYVDGTATTTLSTTDWHHIAITTDTGINASAFTLGKIASAYFSGKIDEVRIYNRALSASEVSGLYMLGRGPWMCGHDTIKDNDGNAYPTVLIGTQCWMAQNLMTTTYSDGSPITRGPVGATWNGADNGYYAYPPNTANTAEETLANIQSNKLGFVYQWSAAMKGSTTEGAQGICPAGWHLPTDAEQNTLDQYLTDGGQTCDASRSGTWDCSSAGTKLKTGGTSGWNGALAGIRNTPGGFFGRSASGYFWSSSQSGGVAWYRILFTSYSTVYRSANSKANGFSVRCLKD